MTNPDPTDGFREAHRKDQSDGDERTIEYYFEHFPNADVNTIRAVISQSHDDSATIELNLTRHADSVDVTQVGPYRILGELGRGGQGVVYLAEDTRLGRKVALKVLTGWSQASPKVVTRFQREAAIASKLDHPGICTVYETGAVDGAPYLAMRHIEGLSLSQRIATAATAYAPADTSLIGSDRSRGNQEPEAATSTSHSHSNDDEVQRIAKIMEDVARALHAAHEVGIIHRDIKPGNIMVTPDDQPVILDFGLARDTEGEHATLTQTGDIFGTPAYMAPEQLMGQRIPIDRRADIWGLGITLFESLTLQRPFTGATRDSLYHAILHKPLPDVRKRNSHVAKDLKVIIETALQKQPNRRYQTAQDLAEDLRRYRENRPIHARPASPLLRVFLWAQRNTAVAVLSVLLFCAMAAGLAWTAMQNTRLEKQSSELTRSNESLRVQTEEAETARDRAQRVAEFQAGMLTGLSPYRLGQSLLEGFEERIEDRLIEANQSDDEVKRQLNLFRELALMAPPTDVANGLLKDEILARAAKQVDEEFSDDPATEATLRQALADVYRALGLLTDAHVHQQRARELRSTTIGPLHPDTLRTINQLALLLLDLGKANDALPLMTKVMNHRRQSLGDEHPESIVTISNVGTVYKALGNFDEAEALLEEAYDLAAEYLEETDPKAITALNNLANLLSDLDRDDEAEPMLREALDRYTTLYGENDERTISAMNNLGLCLQAQKKFDEAETLLGQALEHSRKTRGRGHMSTLTSLNNFGTLLMAQGRLAEATPILEEVAKLQAATLGTTHRSTMTALNNLGLALKRQGARERALTIFTKVLDWCRASLSKDHRLTLDSVNNMGTLLSDMGRFDEALPLYEEALRGFEEKLGPDHASTVAAVYNLTLLLRETGNTKDALPLAKRVLHYRRANPGKKDQDLVNVMMALADLLSREGQADKATALLSEALTINRRELGNTHAQTLTLINNLAFALANNGKLKESEPLFRENLTGCRQADPESAETLTALNNLGMILKLLDKPKEAEPLLRESLGIKRRLLGNEHSSTITSITNLGSLLKQQGKFEDARPLLQEALNLNRKVNGDAHRDTITSMNQLGVLLLDDAKPADAEPLLRGALAATLKSQGSTHPDTLNARNNIVSLLLRQGKLSEAEKVLDQLVQDTPANSPRLPGRKDLLAQIRAKLK